MNLFVQARLEFCNEHGFQNSSNSQWVGDCDDSPIKMVMWILSEASCSCFLVSKFLQDSPMYEAEQSAHVP